MTSSCSSENNGCISCAPNLSLWSISASTSQSKVGHGCINGDSSNDPYAIKVGSANSNYNASDNVICLVHTTNVNYSYYESYSYIVDKFGLIAIGIDANIGMSSSDYMKDGCTIPTSNTSIGSYKYLSIAKKNSCEEDSTSSNGDIGTIPGSLYCTPPAIGSEDCSESCNRIDTCALSQSSYKNQCSASFGEVFANSNEISNVNFSLSSQKNLLFFYNLCKSSVDTKMSLLENNNAQNCNGDRCGDQRDDCWGAAGSFSIADNNLDDPNANSTTSQKLKFKIAAPKERFEKKYKSISGKVIFYYGGTNGKTPCCDDDFDGTIVEEQPYSISTGSTFKDDYFAVDCGEFDNDNQTLVGETINICYTVDNIEFV